MEHTPNVILVGGPQTIPPEQRIRYVPALDAKVKVPYLSGYEHFAPTGGRQVVEGNELGVFTWVGATRIAE
jgi:hypothetical protein